MTALNPKITLLPNGNVKMTWTPDPAAFGYRFYVDSHPVSKSVKPGQTSTTFAYDGQPTAYGIAGSYEQAAETVVFPAPPDPPPPPPPPPTGLVVAPPVGPFTLMDGNYAAASHPQAFRRGTDPYTIRKLHVREYTGYGIGSMQYYPPTVQQPARTLVEDCVAESIQSNPPGSMDGKGETGFWFGNPTDARRLRSSGNGWMGMWTGSRCSGSIIEDFEIDQSVRGIGLYVEHVTANVTFRRFKIRSAGNGINIEWWYGGEGSHDLLFEDGEIYCPAPTPGDPKAYTVAGIFADAGTYGCTFRRIRFHGPGNAIGLPNRLVDPSKPNKVESCTFDNDGADVYYHSNAIG